MAQQSQPKLARASFRGVSFVCTAHDLKAGRRIADHVFPQRDLGYHEDMGRQDREVSLTAYLNGDDAADQPELGRAFIRAAARALQPHGRLLLVANRHLAYEQTLQHCFARTAVLAEAQGFKVIRAQEPRA